MGMKVYTDTESQFFARVFQPTASNLKMEPVQTTASNLQMTANQTSASLLQATVRQTSASLLNATVRQTNAANLVATVRNSATASLLKVYATVVQSTASALQITLADRATVDTNTTVGVTSSTTYTFAQPQYVLNLSQFAFVVQGGTAATNIKIQLSAVGGTVAENWVDDDTVTRTLAANAITILQMTKFAKYVRFGAKKSGAASATLTVYNQGHV